MSSSALLALLTLQRIPNLGDASIKKLIRHFGAATTVLEQKKAALLEVEGIGAHRLEHFYDPAHAAFAKAELRYIEGNGIAVLGYQDEAYPERLRHCLDGPVLLFQKGTIDWDNPRMISIVGTRKMTAYGAERIDAFMEEIATLDPVIISGFAYGVDIAAHRAAMRHGLQTVACLAHGLDKLYPAVHRKYVAGMEQRGGFVTDFWSTDHFDRKNFLRRNRIIAGLSEATVVMESAAQGGSLVTAELANSYARDVFAVPGRVNDPLSVGCNNLIKQNQAHLLTSAADLIYIMNWTLDRPSQPIQKQLFLDLEPQEQEVFNVLERQHNEQLDTIALQCMRPPHQVASTLLSLELKGVVRPLPGKRFELT
ncbi:DNA-processing protein DprA [Croceiramulus getboli]|nr:DNA-processing protein DprA [Flavobacteriaceae bacterium YJPT1-3]